MAYKVELQRQMQFFRAIKLITQEAEKQAELDVVDGAELYEVLMWELTDTFNNNGSRAKFYREIENWARTNAEQSEKLSAYANGRL